MSKPSVEAVEIKTIVVKVKEHELNLSVDDARKLLTALGDLLGREVVKETRVVNESIFIPEEAIKRWRLI